MPMSTRLSDREVEVVRYVAKGLTNQEIGRSLYLSSDTVKTHLRRISRKLGVRNRAEIAIRCLRDGIIT